MKNVNDNLLFSLLETEANKFKMNEYDLKSLDDFMNKFVSEHYKGKIIMYNESEELFLKFLENLNLDRIILSIMDKIQNMDTEQLYKFKRDYERTNSEIQLLNVILKYSTSKNLLIAIIVFYYMIKVGLINVDENDELVYYIDLKIWIYLSYLKLLERYAYLTGNKEYSVAIREYRKSIVRNYNKEQKELNKIMNISIGKIYSSRITFRIRIDRDLIKEHYRKNVILKNKRKYDTKTFLTPAEFVKYFAKYVRLIKQIMEDDTGKIIKILFENVIVLKKYKVDVKELETMGE